MGDSRLSRESKMARLHFVKKAQKDNPVCKKGESYFWWKFMVGGRGGPKLYSKERPAPSRLTQSEFLGTLGDIEDEISSLAADDSLESAVSDIASRLRELGEEQGAKKENMPDNLQESESGTMLQDRADRCEEMADELENIPLDLDDKEADQEEEDFWREKLDEVQAVDLST
jgi:hypothetical protein